MKTSRQQTLYFDFEQPLIELESQLDDLNQLITKNGIDATVDLQKLQARTKQLRQEILSRTYSLSNPTNCPSSSSPSYFRLYRSH